MTLNGRLWKTILSIVFIIICVIIHPLFFRGCASRNIIKMSPDEIVKLEIVSYMSADRETLRKILFFPPEMSEEEITQRLSTNVADTGEKMVRTLYCENIEYSRLIDDNTAEVGTVITGRWFMFFVTRKPFRQIILKKDAGIWKIYYTTDAIPIAKLREMQQVSPREANTYYLLGDHMLTSNSIRSLRCFKKYLELSPSGFWVSDDLHMKIKMLEGINFDQEEDRVHGEWEKFSSPERNKAYQIAYLARLFWEKGNIEKVEYYLKLGDDICKRYPKAQETIAIKRFFEAKTEIENEMKRGASSGADCY